MFERFDEIYRNRHDYAREWKRSMGGKVVGYCCTYTPEENLVAATILPVRILRSHGAQSLSITPPHISAMYVFSFSGKVFKTRKEKGVLRKTLIEMG